MVHQGEVGLVGSGGVVAWLWVGVVVWISTALGIQARQRRLANPLSPTL